MTTPTAPRKVRRDETLAASAAAIAGEGTRVVEGHVVAARDGVFEFDAQSKRCTVRPPRRPVAGTRRQRGERAPTDADLRTTDRAPRRATSRDAARLKKKKGRGDQGTWM